MLRLSNELLLKIIKYLYFLDPDFVQWGQKEDLLATRAACRRLANIGTSLAFEHITFIHGEQGYANLLQMSRSPQLCQSVRRLTFSFKSFNVDPTLEQFKDSRGIYIDSNQPTAEELNELYATYCHGCERQQ